MTTYTAHEILGGLYEKTVKMTVDRRLRYAPYAQAGWIDTIKRYTDNESNGKLASYCKAMYSYSSLIFTATVNEKGVEEISVRNADAAINCSRTTSRQVTLAMREIGLTDSTISRLKKWFTSDPEHVTAVYIGRGEWMDACTGEVLA